MDKFITEDNIKRIYWIGPNKDDDYQEDIVIELLDGKQYSLYLNKNLSSSILLF
mgnify:CR=1 FL=1